MPMGTVMIEGREYVITRLQLHGGLLKIHARHDGPVPPCEGKPAAVFGEDGQGVCQSWEVDIPAQADRCDFVTVVLPIRIATLDVLPGLVISRLLASPRR